MCIRDSRYTRQDKIILYCGYALLGLFLLAIIVPMIYIVIASFMDPVTPVSYTHLSLSCGSAVYFNSEPSAVNREDAIVPASTR